MSLDDGLKPLQTLRMSLDDDELARQTARMNLDDDRAMQETARMGMDDDRAMQETARMGMDDADVLAETARMSLADETLSAETARSSLDDSILSSPLARMSLHDDELISDRVRLSFASARLPAVSAHYQQGLGKAADYLCDGAAPLPRQWFKAGYLMMWTKASRIPWLVTTSDAADAGIVGRATTSTVFGDTDIDGGYRNGLRLNYGHRLKFRPEMAFEIDYFSAFDDTRSGDYYGTAATNPVLARPFFNPTTNLEDSRIIASPGVSDGSVGVFNTSESHSVALLLRNNYRTASDGRIDILSGYRHFRYRDGIYIHENRVAPIPGGTTYDGHDWFRSENEFHGGELGVHTRLQRGAVTFDVLAKIAVGAVRHNTLVEGRTTTTIPGAFPVSTFSEGGLLAAPTNIHRHSGSSFAALPELGISATVPLTRSVSLQAGYSFLWMNDVIRAADLIDRRVNPTQLLGGTLSGVDLPFPVHTESDFWMQGVNLMLLIEG